MPHSASWRSVSGGSASAIFALVAALFFRFPGLPTLRAFVSLGVDPMELLRMINGRSLPTKAIVAGLARELDSDLLYLEKLAEEIRNDQAVK
jgi:hypothetical protein